MGPRRRAPLSEANHCGFLFHREYWCSYPAGLGAVRLSLVPVWGLPAHPGQGVADGSGPELTDGLRGDGAHPCPEKRRTGCCPASERRDAAPGWEAWDAEWAAGSWLKVWGSPDWRGRQGSSEQPDGWGWREPQDLEPAPCEAFPERREQAPRPVQVWARPSSLGASPGRAQPVPQLRVEAQALPSLRAEAQGIPQALQVRQEAVWELLPVWLEEPRQGQRLMRNAPEGVSPPAVRSSTRRNVRTHPFR